MLAVQRSGFPRAIEEISPEWLTETLAASGALSGGRVTSIEAEAEPMATTAKAARLRLTYDGAPPDAPASLFAKLPFTMPKLEHIVRWEIRFYADFAGRGLPVPRCYAAACDPSDAFGLLLLQDVSRTHVQTEWPLPPPRRACEGIVKSWARLHAAFWDDPDLVLSQEGFDSRKAHWDFADEMAARLPDLLAFLDDRLTPDQADLLARTFDRMPRLVEARMRDGGAWTLAHGDAHFWNALYPTDPGSDDCVLIDWQDWGAGVGTFDLAYMIALQWRSDRRARVEAPLLRLYHETLGPEIARTYPFERLMEDYRLGLMYAIAVAVVQWDIGFYAAAWWARLECGLQALEDLDCRALL